MVENIQQRLGGIETDEHRQPEVLVHINKLNLTSRKHKFDRTHQIKNFYFITLFRNEADIINMSEAQTSITLPKFLGNPSETHFRTNLSRTSRHDEVTCWPRAIRYLLRTYTTVSAMGEVLEDLRNVRQKAEKVEEN